MKLFEITQTFDFLIESNIVNVKQDYNGQKSIVNTAAELTKDLDPAVRGPLSKRLSKWIIDDFIGYQQMSKVPANAPQWMADAIKAKDLGMFVLDDDELAELVGFVDNIETLFLKAGISGVKTVMHEKEWDNARNQAHNMADLDEENAWSDDDFNNVNKKDFSGLTEVMKTNEHTWWEITTQTGLEREGKILQNCFGKEMTEHHFPTRHFYIAKREAGETVVGLMILKADNTVLEIKGKQNKPPVKKYVNETMRFLKAIKAKPSEKVGRCIHVHDDMKGMGVGYEDGRWKVYT